MQNMYILVVCLFYCLWSSLLSAAPSEQRFFNRTSHSNHYEYHYIWLDHNNQRREVRFNIDKQDLVDLPTNQSNYKPQLINNQIREDMVRLAQRVNPKRARINIQQFGNEVRYNIRGSNQALVALLYDEFSLQQDISLKHYFKENYFHYFTSVSGERAVKADHIRYIQEFTPVLKPAATAFYESLGSRATLRDFLELVLSWAQSLPYNELTGRGESNGSGFFPPISVLNANLGDCDSKSVVVAALIRSLLPNISLRFVLLPNHALLGITTKKETNDYAVNDQGLSLVVLEPTGPAPLGVGELAASSRHFIERGLVQFEEIPRAAN